MSRTDWLLIAAAVILAGAAAAWWLAGRRAPPPAAPVLAEAPPAPPEAPAAPAATPDVGPDQVRALLEAVSADPRWRRWLAQGSLVERWVVVVDNLAEGVTPRRQLEFLAPARPFSVVERRERTVIAPESYRRYDAFGDVVSTVDPAALAQAYRTLHPALEAAYRALGYPDARLDDVAARALARLVAAPVVDGDVVVEPAPTGAAYLLADPRLERLGAVEKHLLRLGPRNARMVQAKARALQQALGLPASPPHR